MGTRNKENWNKYQSQYRIKRFQEDPVYKQKVREDNARRYKKLKESMSLEDWKLNNRLKSLRSRGCKNFSLKDFFKLLEIQENCCAICFVHFKTREEISVDHDHVTGLVRGLLCHHCNTGIGLLGDNVDNLQTAIDYLLRTGN